jgi:oligoribonuclease NrnB/cAMP/cGMP phosphodiesterase (DHH superfamily)
VLIRNIDTIGTVAPTEIVAVDCAVLNCTGEISEIGNTLALTYPCVAMWFETETGEIVYSLRSSAENPDHVDVSVIAKCFGGGGHKHAAGFKVLRPVHRRQA